MSLLIGKFREMENLIGKRVTFLIGREMQGRREKGRISSTPCPFQLVGATIHRARRLLFDVKCQQLHPNPIGTAL